MTRAAPACNITLDITAYGVQRGESLRIADISKNQIRELAQEVIDTCVDGGAIGGRQTIGGFATHGLNRVSNMLGTYRSYRATYGTRDYSKRN